MYGSRSGGDFVFWILMEALEGNPFAVSVVFGVIVTLIGVAILTKYCAHKFGTYESFD